MIKIQLELEQSMMESGAEKYMALAEKKMADDFETTHAQMIVKDLIIEFSNHLTGYYDGVKNKNAKSKLSSVLGLTLKSYNPEYKKKQQQFLSTGVFSYITVRAVLSGICKKEKRFDSVAILIGDEIDSNVCDADKMDLNTRGILGGSLLLKFIELYPQYIEVFQSLAIRDARNNNIRVLKHKTRIIKATDSYVELVMKNRDLIAELTNDMLPMIVKPKLWDDNGENGGYYSPELRRPLVKRSALGGCKPSLKVIRAVNAVQSTPWRVNGWILDLLIELSKSPDLKLNKLFPHNIPKMGPCEVDIKKENKTTEEKLIIKQYFNSYNFIEKKRCKKRSIDLSRNAAISQAQRFRDYPEIYFPFDIDYRDRFYAIPMSGINIQGSDMAKSLVEFANGKPIKTARGLFWYKVNLAGLCGHDDLTLDDRVKWVDDNEDIIRAVVADPLGTIAIWVDFDKQLQGLSACKGWVDYLTDPTTPIHVNIQLDGCCNAHQHLAALTRDNDVARHVGLVPIPKKGDLYMHVCDGLTTNLTKLNNELSKIWLSSGLVDRPLTKTPVMVRSYGATLGTVRQHCTEIIMDNYLDADKIIPMTQHFADYTDARGEQSNLGHVLAGRDMAEMVWDAMSQYMRGGMAFMEWAQKCASVLGKAGLTTTWYNAAGMLCEHKPIKMVSHKIEAKFKGTTIKFNRNLPTDDILGSKLRSSISPNLIHSNDAAGMVITICLCLDEGITDYGMVHDSYSTHADDTQHMIESIKISWVEMYQDNNWMQIWRDRWAQQIDELGNGKVTSDDLPPVVELGTLEAKSVMGSDYFFF